MKKAFQKRISLILAVLLAVSLLPLAANNVSAVNYKLGDVDNDGAVTAGDARLALRKSVGLEYFVSGSREFLACDVDCDKMVTAADARVILRVSVGLESFGEIPVTKSEIIAFYAKAVNDVKNNGTASYRKKEYQTLGTFNITGNGFVDSVIKDTAEKYFKNEASAEFQTAEKGKDSSKEKMLGWNLKDYSKVVSAKLKQNNGNYDITLVMAGENTPHKGGGSHLDAVGSVILWEDIDAELKNISALKEYDIRIKYQNYTIKATLSPEGKLIGITHHCDITIEIRHAKILIVTLENKNVDMENTVIFSDFAY